MERRLHGTPVGPTAQGQTIVESAIDAPGSGVAAIDLPQASLPIDTVTFAFIPPKAAGLVEFEVSSVGLGPRAPDGADILAAGESTTCETCEPPASRLDPCGPFLATVWVSAADSREGRGIRCVSTDLRAWYGEGWWVDPDVGRYRHLGYVIEYTSGIPSLAVAVDFGVRPPPAEGDLGYRPTYGTRGPQLVRIELIDFTRLHVFTDRRSIDEIWTIVPKGDLLPAFFGPLPWDGTCGTFGLHQFEAVGDMAFLRRCAMPSDLRVPSEDFEHTSLPVVWYGESYLLDVHHNAERTHLGWLPAPPTPPSPVGVYTAVDRCVLAPAEVPCGTFDVVTMERLGPGVPRHPPGSPQRTWEDGDYWLEESQGLYVTGPAHWQRAGNGHLWHRLLVLPEAAALPAPTPICLDADCP